MTIYFFSLVDHFRNFTGFGEPPANPLPPYTQNSSKPCEVILTSPVDGDDHLGNHWFRFISFITPNRRLSREKVHDFKMTKQVYRL